MSLDLARQIARALDITSESKIRMLDRALQGYVRLTRQSPVTEIAGSIDATQVDSGTFADARVAESNVTQHEAALELDALQVSTGTFANARISQGSVTQHQAALDHDALANFVAAEHIPWAVTGAEDVHADRISQASVVQHEAALDIDWLQLTGVPLTFPPESHLEVGSWTPVDASAAALTFAGVSAHYSRHEEVVIARTRLAYPVTASGANALISGLPAVVANDQASRQGFVSWSNLGSAFYVMPVNNTNRIEFWDLAGAVMTNAMLSGRVMYLTLLYRAA